MNGCLSVKIFLVGIGMSAQFITLINGVAKRRMRMRISSIPTHHSRDVTYHLNQPYEKNISSTCISVIDLL